ncbi:universal stress protein [Bacillus gobiensis]|uniref:Universal stress protein n=1 Tax=Bacillus gobiensis TaxID=1441095 RepID=A0A0M4FHF9_9BACI|nr:universal stress protein [Bacillus gobiensis]ALC82161.1 universal stress protein [Bacillus gobiensis]
MYQRILLAVDGSEHSSRATDHAIALSLVTGAEIELIYVLDYSKAKSEVLHSGNSLQLKNERQQRLKKAEEKLQKNDVSYQITMKHGEPGPTIVEHANRNNVDIVIIGSRGLNSLQEMVLGSVSHKVAKRASCPVLIVK